MIILYHNPRCSKSRNALTIIEQFSVEQSVPFIAVDYLNTPLSIDQLTALHALLGGSVRDMVRDNESEYAQLNLAQADDNRLLEAIAQHPKLLQRPIVAYGEKAIIARPPEQINAFLEAC